MLTAVTASKLDPFLERLVEETCYKYCDISTDIAPGCAITASLFATFSQGFGPLALAPMFPYYIEEFHCSLAGAVAFTGVAILILGFSNFLW